MLGGGPLFLSQSPQIRTYPGAVDYHLMPSPRNPTYVFTWVLLARCVRTRVYLAHADSPA